MSEASDNNEYQNNSKNVHPEKEVGPVNTPAITLVLNPDELGPDPAPGMDLALKLGIRQLEIRSADGVNALALPDRRLSEIRVMAENRGLKVAALASPLWKWCLPEASPAQVDSFGFPVRIDAADRLCWIERAVEVAVMLGAPTARVFSHLRVQGNLTESLTGDPLLPRALELAASAGVRLLLENEPVCTIARGEALLEVLEQYHGQGLGLWLDLANLCEVGEANRQVVGALAPYAGYVHVKDYRPAAGGNRVFCPAGAGVVPYGELLPLLSAAGPGLPYALETHVRDAPAAALTAGAAFLRGMLPGCAA